MKNLFFKLIAAILLAVFISQVLPIQRAQAQFIPIPLPTIVVNPVATTVIADGPRVYEKIAIGIARGILEKFTE
ncbi:MAG: hypothetical protein KW802_04515, partial [Candidatus Doudnabacteria bacterium]|nr:hypothetical protein [Candidatus Doudnabacteria bacterium]